MSEQFENNSADLAKVSAGHRGSLQEAAASYLAHVVEGKSIRSIAQRKNVHPSTIMRRIRKIEGMRDDPVLDQYLSVQSKSGTKAKPSEMAGGAQMDQEQKLLLRRLSESGAVLVVSKGLKKAVILRSQSNGQQTRTAVVNAHLAGACVIRDWIRCNKSGRVSCYEITEAGRMALKRVLAEDAQKTAAPSGFAEAPSVFSEQHKDWGERVVTDEDGKRRPVRVNLRESPLTILGRKKDRGGKPFLSPDLLEAGERLREDFELAQMGPSVAQNWDRFLTGGQRGTFGSGDQGGMSVAQDRLGKALSALGPGLGDIALRCCCFLEGLETAERRMGWSARSGKIVLRIALQRLRHFYDTETTRDDWRIG